MKTKSKRSSGGYHLTVAEEIERIGAVIGCGLMATACMGALMFFMWLLANAPWTS